MLYGIDGDIIRLYYNRRAENDRVDIKTNSDFTKRQLYGWERWQNLLTNKIQGIWEKGFRGLASISWMPDGENGVFNYILMPQQQEGNNVSTPVSLYGFSRYAIEDVYAGKALGWKPSEQRPEEFKMGNSIRKLAGQKDPQRKESELQQSELTNNETGERTYQVGSKEWHRQQKAYIQSARNESAFHFRNMSWFINQRLWVRETFCNYCYRSDGIEDACYKEDMASNNMTCENMVNIPSIFMPRWASRITLEITGVRVERVQDITESQCIKEGSTVPFEGTIDNAIKQINWFKNLWDSINAKRGFSWESNPWVWVIEFEKINDK